jgi:hypothetical protein
MIASRSARENRRCFPMNVHGIIRAAALRRSHERLYPEQARRLLRGEQQELIPAIRGCHHADPTGENALDGDLGRALSASATPPPNGMTASLSPAFKECRT